MRCRRCRREESRQSPRGLRPGSSPPICHAKVGVYVIDSCNRSSLSLKGRASPHGDVGELLCPNAVPGALGSGLVFAVDRAVQISDEGPPRWNQRGEALGLPGIALEVLHRCDV